MPLPLSPQVFAITARLIEERSGLHYDVANLDLLADKLSDRAAELGLESLLDYYYLLRYDDPDHEETARLVESLVVHETYFFREMDPLRVLVDHIVPELLRTRPQVRIWSAACATGEEPYTLGILLSDAGLLDRVELVASDISDKALAKARAGLYGGRSLRALSQHGPGGHLVEETPGIVRVRDDLRRRVAWKRVNLLEGDAVVTMGSFDVILCRNVLIYFADDTVTQVARSLAGALRRDGWLLVGTSESLMRFGTLFTCQERGGAFFYRRAVE
jgi:chemotaxis protein methyltransferase CheR